jgi:tetratricopeptide (TPR) repeat protein
MSGFTREPAQIESTFRRALALHRQGNLTQAAQLYENLRGVAQTREFDVLHMLGVIRAQQERLLEALELIGGALSISQTAAALSNFGNVLAALRRWPEALAHYDQALALHAAHAGALKGRGDALVALDRAAEAVESYGKAIEGHPGFIDAWNGRANAWRALNRFAEALADCNRALAGEPDFAEALYNRGYALFGLSRFAEAIAAFDRAIALKPGDAAALNQKGMALRRLGRREEAIQCYDMALAIAPGHADILSNRGVALHDLGRHTDALHSFDLSLAADPVNAKTLNNRATTLHRIGRLADAKRDYEASLAIEASDAEARTNLGVLLRDMDRHDEAIAMFQAAVDAQPEYANAHWNMAVSKLLLGDFVEGWRLYEWRKRLPAPVEARHYARPLWTGAQDIKGKAVFAYAGQGLGDTIQFFRFATALEERGARVILSVQDELVRLLRDSGHSIEIVGAAGIPKVFDYHIPLSSLPLALNSGADLLAHTVPYIRPEAARTLFWRQRIGPEGFKVGISWQGTVGRDNRRAFPLTAFDALADIDGVRLISLQKGSGSEQLAAHRSNERRRIEALNGFDEGSDAFIDTAAVLPCLDLVITLDSAIAHLAGASGRPVWVSLQRVPDWRWQLWRGDSPWYPTMRLFRQQVAGAWGHPFAQMRQDLLSLLVERGCGH